ncbi:NmrA family NAD(P)-binding protein [soil metagenome]
MDDAGACGLEPMLVVTGPTGNVGADIITALTSAAAPPPYRIAAHHPDQLRDHFGPELPIVPFAFDDRATWPAALDGATTLFLLFPLPHPRTARTWMVPFVEVAAEAGVEHVVYVTVPGADRSRLVPHHAVERAIAASAMEHTFLRCAYFSQNLVRALSTHGVDIADRSEVFVPARRSLTTFLDARDVADAVLRIVGDRARHAGRSYLLTGPEALTFEQVAEILTSVLARPIRYADPSVVQFWRRLRRRGVSRDTVAFMELVYRLARRGSNAPRSDDLAELLDRAPRTFRQFATENRWRWEQRAWT